MAKRKLLTFAALAVLLSLVSIAAARSQPEQLIGEGAIVAFHKQWRHPAWNPNGRDMSEFATRADLWIVRIDHWVSGNAPGKYFLVNYMLYEKAVSNREINQPKLRFQLRRPQEADGAKPCMGVGAQARIADFERTQPGRADSIPPLKEIACLVAEKPPTLMKGQAQTTAIERTESVDLKTGNLHLTIPLVQRGGPGGNGRPELSCFCVLIKPC